MKSLIMPGLKMNRFPECLFLLLACHVAYNGVQGETYPDLQNLVTTLFSNYTPQLRPFVDDSQPTYVYLGLGLKSIQELNEIRQSLTFTAWLYLGWFDNRLSWSRTDHNFTRYFSYPQKHVWIPDLTIINSMETMKELGFDRNYLHVKSSGRISWLPGGVYRTSCDISVTYYPFDTQECKIIFTTLVSHQYEISILSDSARSVVLDYYSPSGTWDLLSVTVNNRVDSVSHRSIVTFKVMMKRRTTYYVMTIIVPVLFLSLTATLVFALPADSGEKMGTSITVLLAFAVYLTIVSDQMPQTSSSVSILSVYLSVLLAQTALGVILSVYILNLHFRDSKLHPPGARMRTAVFYMQRLMCKTSWHNSVTPIDNSDPVPSSEDQVWTSISTIGSCSPELLLNEDITPTPINKTTKLSSAVLDVSPSPQEKMSWKEVASTLDRFLFYTFSFTLVSATVICLTVLVI